MKWQERFLDAEEENRHFWNPILENEGDMIIPTMREILSRDGRMALFMSLNSPRDIDFSIFPELDFSRKKREMLARDREKTEETNEILSVIGEPPISCMEDQLIHEGNLDAFLMNPLTDGAWE